ncbi:MAG TPA: aromatic ring-hydroxylating dioxygenase subunit alpha [Stellaceae bacterium]|jgi:phenylpropionate dioxygenase-like ring-hydroxylating dioxygenase large terminal subunit|nr:aromatic ring-hydroxylating dioxygenase subunit alpha [Stellaceae bacterium]
MFARNAWYIAAWGDEIGDKPLARRICNEPIVLFRDTQGHAAALADRCCHRSAPLSLGTVVEGGIQCGYHGLVIDAAGKCVKVPGQRQIPTDATVRSYPLVEKNKFLWIWLGDPALADPASIIDFPYHDDHAKWPHKHTMYPIKGNYMLMVDNLMDLTHLGYLHGRTIGGNPSQHVDAEMKTVRTPTGVKFTRWMRNSLPPPSYVKAAGFAGRIDRLQSFEFVAPSTVLQWTGATDAGSGREPDDFEFKFRLFHGLTPETETSCFYFWSAANGYRQNEPATTEQLYGEIAVAFLEDRDMVEAQQTRLGEFGEDGLIDIASDATRMTMRRHVDRMIAAERQQQAAE